MSYDNLRRRILDELISASDGNHSARLWRVAENIQDYAHHDPTDERLLHLLSRVGVLCRGLAKDLRTGHTTIGQAATLLDQLADLGDLNFEEWVRPS
jgi:hypothetical protein